MNRKAKLEKALAFDQCNFETSNEATARGKWSYPSANRRLAPLHAALIEAIENLEDIRAWCKDRDAKPEIVNMKCLSLSSEALFKIDKVLEEE